jgi:exopolysaccharide production protein ExoZ
MLQRSPVPSFASIQILRAVAALAIVIHHGLHEADVLARRFGSSFDWQSSLPLPAGVDLFFVISGFVMVHAARDRFGSKASILPFLRRRLARTAPIYWVTTLLFLLTLLSGLGGAGRAMPSVLELAASLLFLPFARPDGAIQPLFGLGWTLNYEMMFYLIFALALPLQRHVAVPAVVGLLVALTAIGHFVPYQSTMLYFWTRPIILEFGFGMLIGHMALSGVRPSRSMAIMLIAVALFMLVAGKLYPQISDQRALLYGLPAALLVIAALAFDIQTPSVPLLSFGTSLGDASYALYLLHPFILRGIAVLAGGTLAAISPMLFLLIGVTLSIIVAMMAWRWFEKPLTKALQGKQWQGN